MDGIQPFAGGNRPLVATVHPSGPSPSSVKTASNYMRAVRRRIWLVLAIAIPFGTAGTLFVLRMQPVYSVSASIEVKPPKVDAAISNIVATGDTSRSEAVDEKYIPDTVALLNSKSLAKEVFDDAASGLPPSAFEGDPAAELMAKVKVRQIPLSHFFMVTLEGKDPDRITRTLNFLLEKFRIRADRQSRDAGERAQDQASATLRRYEEELKATEEVLSSHILKSSSLAPGGKNLKEAHFEAVRQRYYYQQQQLTNLQRQSQMDLARQAPAPDRVDSNKAQKIAALEETKKALNKRLGQATRISKDPYDPAIIRAKTELAEAEADIAALQSNEENLPQGPSPAEAYESILAGAIEEIKGTEGELTTVLSEMKQAMPEHQKYIKLMAEWEQKSRQLSTLKEKMNAFAILSSTQNSPVKVVDPATEPNSPIRPNRTVYIGVSIVFSLALGLALVCFLEHIDHSVKVPEHLTLGLSLPLFGVVPRMLRNSRNHRGGHLWTPGIPDSIEADAYRNLRASLLGATQTTRPIVTLLVTSAKAGEGKSTTALNLAATCARAGERTLLMDVDLRRPSLNDVFPPNGEGTGLVDILRGDLPWQRTVVQTDLPNLDFLPTGETRDVPIEVLGSLELRQLLISLSQHHYDRVILDGPAVLGLADCRMLGRIVDAAVMVVRSGSQELRPLQRAKSMLEQSQVHIAGVVFNGLNEDLQNWSSYGPNTMLDSSTDFANARPAGASRGLDAPSSRAAALMASVPVEA